MSKQNEYLKIAYMRGYRVNMDGSCFSPHNGIINGTLTKGYLKFCIDRTKPVMIHRLQAYQKFGNLIFEEGTVVRHLNGVPTDNSWDNISIGSNSDNMFDIPLDKRIVRSRKATNVIRKLTDDEVAELREMRDSGKSYKEIQKVFPLAKSTISYIVNDKTYFRERLPESKSERPLNPP